MKKNDNKTSKIILISIVITLCILISVIFIAISLQKDNPDNVNTVIQQDVSSIINNLGSKFISQKQSEESGFTYDIYLEFKEDIYVDGKSNERLYTNLMSQVISNLKTSVRFIDESQDLIIRATYDAEENKYYYTVNGEEDYFKKQDSINSLNSYEGTKNTDMRANSKELQNIIDNNWSSSSVNIDGDKTSFNEYDQYFYTGINIRNIMSKVYNIVFTDKYEGEVINGITVGTDREEIIEKLGEPTFEKDNVYGYKNEDFYVFFSSDEISIYRNESYDTENFTSLLSQYLNNEINLKEYMNELTYLWDDYSKYDYSSNYITIEYPLRGLRIDMDSNDDTLGIEIYDNFTLNDDIRKFIIDGKITSKVDTNLVIVSEVNRINKIADERYKSIMSRNDIYSEESEETNYKSNLYSEYFVRNNNGDIINMRLYSIDQSKPDIELKLNVYTLLWMSDTQFIYSIKNKGIYYYDILTEETQEIYIGNEEFYLKEYNDGILKYDDEIIEIIEE